MKESVALAITNSPCINSCDFCRRATSANRSLPDIPKDRNTGLDENGLESATQEVIYEAAEIMGDPSELYATVQDKNPKRDCERGTRGSSQESSSLQEDDSAYPYARLNTLNSTTDEHPYAQVQSIQKSDINRQNSFRNPSQIIDASQPCSSTSQTTNNPVAPPRTRRSSSHNSLLNIDAPIPDIQAANAITGGVQANQDLPYMTPPLLMSLPRLPQPQHNGPQHFSGDSQDSKGYTSISVREPLANIIAQTKAAQQNRPHRPTDSHYATVSDDSDEMYAAIDEQEKIYTSGSETYAQIQPMVEQIRVPVEPIVHVAPSRIITEDNSVFTAPQPPSVDSLRHVAHAHSRQASSSSATSSIANPSSPKPEKRQANSPLPPPPPPLPPAEGTDVYALIDKHAKPEDQTLTSVKSLEDMYAKVMKKKRDSDEEVYPGPSTITELPVKKLSLAEISRASWSSHDSVDIQKREPEIQRTSNVPDMLNLESSIEFSKVARIYELDRVTPDHVFDPINSQRLINNTIDDPNYEMLRPFTRPEDVKIQSSTSTRNGIDVLPFYSVPFKHRQVSNASSEDPGYEKVRLRRPIERDPDTDSEPNYESMPHDPGEPNYASVCRTGDSDTDPNYESVRHSDPNYESVRYMSVAGQKITTEPPYERVNLYNKNDKNVDGYEKVKCKQNDPNYEKIHMASHAALMDNTDTDDEQYVQV